MRGYKLTNPDGTTYGGMRWGPGVTHDAKPGDGYLCTDQWIHFYIDPLMAVFMNPIQGDFDAPWLWEIEADGDMKDDNGLKCGAKTVTTLHTIPLPVITGAQRVAAAIYIARAIAEALGSSIPAWQTWGDRWLSGEDRSAYSAYWAARLATGSVRSAADLARSVADLARVVADSARLMADSAGLAADSAYWAARLATGSVRSAADSARLMADLARLAADSARLMARLVADSARLMARSAAYWAARLATDSARLATGSARSAADSARLMEDLPSLILLCLYAAMEGHQ